MVAASSALLSGIVKAVPSGDTIVVMKSAAPVNGPPPEMRLTLASLKAPLLSRDGSTDEPYAWESREWLRTKLIGTTVSFHIEYKVTALNRIFATVYHPDSSTDSIGLSAVQAGMVRVRRPNNDAEERAPDFEDLCAAEDAAVQASAGLHSGQISSVARKLPASTDALVDTDMLAHLCKGKKLTGVVDFVANGSALKVFVRNVPSTDENTFGDRILTLCLSGIQCPGFRRNEGDDPSTPPKPMLFAVNAKYLTEIRLLHRDVDISIDGVDRNGILFATIENPKAPMYIGEELLRAGFAKTVSWSIDMSARAPALRAAERAARDRQMGVWKGFKAPTSDPELFVGKCVEVVSGDMIVVLDDITGKTRRISLASVRANRVERSSGRERSAIAIGPATDAKEALRKKLIGRRVSVKVEYTREPSEESLRKDVMVFATVGREGDPRNTDVALPLISNGLLAVVRHRGEEDRATNYEEYLERQKGAMEAKKGVHGETNASFMRINNLTGPDAKKRSRDVLSGLQRNGPYKGIVEYVSSASRYRVLLPSESMLITLALRAVRSPQSTRRTYGPDGSIRDEVAGEAHGDEAADYARENFMQRDVEVEINNVDRVGAFLGNMYIVQASGGKMDVSAGLLELGHGYLHESFDPSRDHSGSKYISIEKQAKEGKKGVWSDYVETCTVDKSGDSGEEKGKSDFVGTVCEIAFGGRIFVQNRDTYKSELATVESGLASLSLDKQAGTPVAGLRPGMVVAAKFSADNRWYRARVLLVQKSGSVDVQFIDYGNDERVEVSKIRRFGGGGAFLNLAPIAVEVSLGNIVVPAQDDACGVAAGEYLREMIYGKDVTVRVELREGPGRVRGDVVMSKAGAASDSAGQSVSVREEILKFGLARIVRKTDRKSKAAFKQLRPFEEIGISTRQYLWNYGEAFESDCDDDDKA